MTLDFECSHGQAVTHLLVILYLNARTPLQRLLSAGKKAYKLSKEASIDHPKYVPLGGTMQRTRGSKRNEVASDV